MFVSDFAIRRPIVTIVTMIALSVFGIAALARLQIQVTLALPVSVLASFVPLSTR